MKEIFFKTIDVTFWITLTIIIAALLIQSVLYLDSCVNKNTTKINKYIQISMLITFLLMLILSSAYFFTKIVL